MPINPPSARPTTRRRLRRLMIIVGVLVVAVLATSGAYVYSIDRSITAHVARQDLLPAESSSPTTSPSNAPTKATPSSHATPSPRPASDPRATGALNYLLLGSDSTDPEDARSGRSDSIILVHLNAARDRAYLISFPRDMYVSIPGHGQNKINAAYSYGGPKLAVATVEELLGIRMDHVALIDFAGFISLTDDLGGVTIDNQQTFSSCGFDYPKGEITIEGERALCYVRERRQLTRGDLDRAENQRVVVQAILAKGLSPARIADPVKLLSFVSGVAKHLTLDSTLSNSEVRSTALSLRLTGSDIKLLEAPISGFATTSTGQSIDVVDKARLTKLSRSLENDDVESYLESIR